jgi:hypothetical protein
MQYEMTLPADYDMEIIHKRIAVGGPVFDDRAGLGLKAFLVRERGTDGSPVNQYAPFYLWHEAGAMARFLVGGDGFERIIRDFGRPPVRHWNVVATGTGPARAGIPVAATRRLTPVSADPDLAGLGLAGRIEREIADLKTVAAGDGVHTAALAVDPERWELVRFILWTDTPPDGEGDIYRVGHLSAPGLAGLPGGRHW